MLRIIQMEYNKESRLNNQYRKGVLEKGEKVQVLLTHNEDKRYLNCVVEQVLDKGLYNMYLCVSDKGNKITITDMDFLVNEAYCRRMKAVIGE